MKIGKIWEFGRGASEIDDSEVEALGEKLRVRLVGGLGNQLFQYAFGRSICDRRGAELVLDASAYGTVARNVSYREVALDAFNIRATISRERTYGPLVLTALQWVPALARLRGVRFEKSQDFDAKAFLTDRYRYYFGYWQSYKYFEDNAKRIANDLQPRLPLSASARSFLSGVRLDRAVGVHVRRGDYVKLAAASSYHGCLGAQYYQEAIAHCAIAERNAHFYVFSDDIDWCRRADLALGRPVTYIEADPQRSDWEELWMMSACTHQIIANSSFSWWAAWLADQRLGGQERCVVAPSRWFAGMCVRGSDRIPRHWLTL